MSRVAAGSDAFHAIAEGNRRVLYRLDAEVLELDPPRRMAWAWSLNDGDLPTTVTFELAPEDGGTRLRLRHEGEIDPTAAVSSATVGPAGSRCWPTRPPTHGLNHKEYVFDGRKGKQTLSELFDGRSQLIVYHFIFDPAEDEGCPHCWIVTIPRMDGMDNHQCLGAAAMSSAATTPAASSFRMDSTPSRDGTAPKAGLLSFSEVVWRFAPAGVGARTVGEEVLHYSLRGFAATSANAEGQESAPRGAETARAPGVRRVVALIPAHNEAEQIVETLASLRGQSYPVERVVVLVDNCTDDTVAVARRAGAEVYETVENSAKKAGALNQGMQVLAGDWRHWDYLLQMDADTILERQFVENAVGELEDDAGLAGVCARFLTKTYRGLLPWLQRMEYQRLGWRTAHRRHKVHCLSGTATLLRYPALPEQPWDERSLGEDHALTLDLLERGWRVKRGDRSIAWTETKQTLGGFWRQRLRRARGTLDELVRRGWWEYGVCCIGSCVGLMVLLLTLGAMSII